VFRSVTLDSLVGIYLSRVRRPANGDDVTYFVGRESVLSTSVPGMPAPLEKLYVLMHRGADSAIRFFNLPADRVFEVGARVEI